MADWKKLVIKLILADRQVSARETRLIKEVISENEINEEELEFLIHIRNHTKTKHPKFEQYFFKCLKKYILKDGDVTSEKAQKIHDIITADEKVQRRERKFIREIKKEAKQCSSKYEELFAEYLHIS